MLPHPPLAMSDDSQTLRDVMMPLNGSTDASARINLAIANAERRAIGLPPQERIQVGSNVRQFPRVALPIPPRVLSRDQSEQLQDAIDMLIEQYSLEAVGRAVAVAKAANGIGGAR